MLYNETLKEVYSLIAPEVNELYEFFRKRKSLEVENDTGKQLDILVEKKYISKTYISDISLIVDYYVMAIMAKSEGKCAGYTYYSNQYNCALNNYKERIKNFLDR